MIHSRHVASDGPNRLAPDGVSIEKAHVGFKGLTVDHVLVEKEPIFEGLFREALRWPPLSIDQLGRISTRSRSGHGTISHVEGREFHQQPIALHLEMGARPPLAALFDDLRLLKQEPNELGYRPLNEPIEIEGNVGEPDPRPLWKIILDAGTQRLLPRLLREDENDEKRDRRRAPLDRLQEYL